MNAHIISYGLGNIGSVRRAIEELGADPLISNDPSEISESACLILPGVGSFKDGMALIREKELDLAIQRAVENGAYLLGICLGMQMLASIGQEGGESRGLDLIPGQVKDLRALGCLERVPHVGWNEVGIKQQSAVLEGIPDKSDFYFVHSYAFVPDSREDLIASAMYGQEFASIVGRERVIGTQFHPEKSSRAGRRLLKNFLELAHC